MKIMIGFIFAVLIAGAIHSCATAHAADAHTAYYPALVHGRYMAVLQPMDAATCSSVAVSTKGDDELDGMCLTHDQLDIVIERYNCTPALDEGAATSYACLGAVKYPS